MVLLVGLVVDYGAVRWVVVAVSCGIYLSIFV